MNTLAVVALFPNCMYYEVAPAVAVLSQFGEVLIATPNGEAITDSCGLNILPSISFEQATNLNFKYLIIPGGDVSSLVGNPSYMSMIQHASGLDAWISAIGSGVDSLRQYGLKGEIPGTDNVLVAKGFVAAQQWANIEFAMTLGIVGGLLSPEAAARKTDEYFGKPSRFSN